jgi:hypothetical protein
MPRQKGYQVTRSEIAVCQGCGAEFRITNRRFASRKFCNTRCSPGFPAREQGILDEWHRFCLHYRLPYTRTWRDVTHTSDKYWRKFRYPGARKNRVWNGVSYNNLVKYTSLLTKFMEDFRKGYYDVVYDDVPDIRVRASCSSGHDHVSTSTSPTRTRATIFRRMTPKQPRCPRELPRCPGAINAGECPRRFRECAFNYIDGQLPK